MRFSAKQVAALCGGELPDCGFAWERVEYFQLEEGILQPYSGDTILPGPGIVVTACLQRDSFERNPAQIHLPLDHPDGGRTGD